MVVDHGLNIYIYINVYIYIYIYILYVYKSHKGPRLPLGYVD